MRPKSDCPVPHFFSLKSSVNKAGTVAFAFVFAFALLFVLVVTLALRFSLRTFAFELLVFADRLSAMTSTTRPTPTMTSAANPPSIHQMAFDFFRGGGAAVGPGVHCCCGGGGGAGGGVGGRRGGGGGTGGAGGESSH